MDIGKLDPYVISSIKGSLNITTLPQCVSELILNSLDAKSTAIAVRINFTSFKIQVVDNGQGISESNLKLVGQEYMTNKCRTLSEWKKHQQYYGFRGRTLWSIAKVSQLVSITSKCEESGTYCKIIDRGDVTITHTSDRASNGTTVTIQGFLSNLPVRQKCIKTHDLDGVKKFVENLIIIHPAVSFTLRNDSNSKILLKSQKHQDVVEAFGSVHPEIDSQKFGLIKVVKNKFRVEGILHQDLQESRKYQYLYVNRRPVCCQKLQTFINGLFKKSRRGDDSKRKYPAFVVHVKCPNSEVDFQMETVKTEVGFKKMPLVMRCVEKMVRSLLGEDGVPAKEKKRQVASQFGVSQILGAVKAYGIKRKLCDNVDNNLSMTELEAPLPLQNLNSDHVSQPKNLPPPVPFPVTIPVKAKRKKIGDDEENFQHASKANTTLATNYPENEEKGKGIILDMFLKSTQVYSDNDEKLMSSSAFEIPDDSNITNSSPNKNCLNLVNNPNKSNEYVDIVVDNFAGDDSSQVGNRATVAMKSVAVQTSPPLREKGKCSIGIQAHNVTPSHQNELCNFRDYFNLMPDSIQLRPTIASQTKPFVGHLSENIDFSKVVERPAKQFNFLRYSKSSDEASLRYHFPLPKTTPPKLNDLTVTTLKNFKLSPIVQQIPSHRTNQAVTQSPYFAPKFNQRRSTNSKNDKMNFVLKLDINKAPNTALPFADKTHEGNSSCGDFLDRGENQNFRRKSHPVRDIQVTVCPSIKGPNRLNETVSRFFTSGQMSFMSEADGDKCELVDLTESPNHAVSLKTNDVSKDLFATAEVNKIKCTVPETSGHEKSNKNLTEWVQEINDFGDMIYINIKSGIQSFRSPKMDCGFEIIDRLAFIPKGLSPVLKEIGEVEAMSPRSRKVLQDAVVEGYEDELLLIKWQNYINNDDPKKFFEEIYTEQSKMIEDAVPNCHRSALARNVVKTMDNLSFTKTLFHNLEVIGQFDLKFIVAFDKTENLLLLFDQHAVHERVRVEFLIKNYKNASMKIASKITIFVPFSDLLALKEQQSQLQDLGLGLTFMSDGLTVYQVPMSIYEKSKKGTDLTALVKKLIEEVVEMLRCNNGVLMGVPRLMQNIINSEACRGAVKFGDWLDKNECEDQLKRLALCDLPFQCAHGRPTITPLVSLNRNCHAKQSNGPNLRKLK